MALTPEYSSIAPVFWYNTKPKEVSYGIDDMDYTGYWGTGFPNVIFPTNVMFKKVCGGINDMTDSAKASDSNTYDLQGRQVNPDHLQPGIYIRNGKKIMVR